MEQMPIKIEEHKAEREKKMKGLDIRLEKLEKEGEENSKRLEKLERKEEENRKNTEKGLLAKIERLLSKATKKKGKETERKRGEKSWSQTSELYPPLPAADISRANGSFAPTHGTHTNRIYNNLQIVTNLIFINGSGNSKGQGKSNPWVIFFRLSILVAVLACAYLLSFPSNKKEKISEETVQRLIQGITDLKGLFPSQNKTIWKEIGTGILGVLNKTHAPGIFLVLASHDKTTNCLTKKVAELTRSILIGTGDVVLTPDKLENDIGEVLDMMGNRVKQTKVVVLLDILSFPPQAIQAFHDICDQYNPLATEAVYVLTMRSRTHASGNLTNFAEKQLVERYSADILEDTLKALIVRITSGAVLVIKEEENIPC